MMGLYHILGEPFGWIMKFIYGFVQNYGVAIILFTLFTKIILFPISYKQMKNTAKMQLINPKLEKLRKSYANNQQKLQEEQMKLYQEEHINPMASCLPMLLQFVILFGVLDVVYRPLHHILRISSGVVENAAKAIVDGKLISSFTKAGQLRDELYIVQASSTEGGSKILSGIDAFPVDKVTDFFEKFQIFGIHLGAQPTIHPEVWNAEAIALCAIPIISGALQLILTIIGQKNAKAQNPDMGSMKGMNMMMYIMPLFSVWFAFVVPAGVGFYWICSSFFSLIQTIGLNLYFTPERSKVIAEKEQAKAKEKAQKLAAAGKKTFAQRLAEVQGENPDLAAHAAAADKETAGMSRKEVSKHNREKLNEVRKELAEKYGDQVTEAEEYDDSGDSEELKAARKRMAEKYGDKY